MMKKLLVLLAFFATMQMANAQFNVTYISDLPYSQDLNDIWGYAAPDGTEYALVGTRTGTSIVSLADPENPEEVAFIGGDNSTWRDIKTWGTTAYVTTDTGDDGLTVIDLSDLPNSATSFNMTDFGTLGTLNTCHNIWIDEFGYAYLAGCNLNGGGMIFIDCFTTPGQPIYAGVAPNTYAHDVYTRDNLMYASEIYGGEFGIYDVSDKNDVQFLGSQETDFSFTHNAWLNDAGDALFTTDELGNAPIGSYDVSDPSDIKTLDLFKPLITQDQGVIPHNVHVWQDWIIVSYYTDGCIIIDGANPSNLIEVGNFDTYIPNNTGFDGAWGAYPFLPSGLIIVSDIGNGLYVLEPNYVRACWLEGKITDANTTIGINGATVDIETTELNEGNSDATGEYKTGLATSGSYSVTYAAPGYVSQTLLIDFENGVLNIVDVALEPLPNYVVSGTVLDELSGEPVPNAQVVLTNNDFTFTEVADIDGNFTFNTIFEGEYQNYTGSWGHLISTMDVSVAGQSVELIIELDRGYRDEFALDLGWAVSGDAETGAFERGIPQATFLQGTAYNPDGDLDFDLGDQCYVTGAAAGGGAGTFDVDNGNTILTSPPMDLSQYTNVEVTFYASFANGGGNGDPNDELFIRVLNGGGVAAMLTIDQNTNGWDGPYVLSIPDDLVTNNMTAVFETGDQPGTGHLVEAAIDLFEVTGDFISSNNNINTAYEVTATPNPFRDVVNINYDFPTTVENAQLVIYNSLGQVVSTRSIADQSGVIIIDDLKTKGLYLVQIEADGFVSAPVKVIKGE